VRNAGRGIFGALLVWLALAGTARIVEQCTAPPPAPRAVARRPRTPADRVVELTNAERQRRGLKPLAVSPGLSAQAAQWSAAQANARRMKHSRGGYRAENVAVGQPTPEAVVTAWMNSRGHRKNILNSSLTTIGVGCSQSSNGRPYWTQQFQ
jgi:uncharacterized protein YkwD